MRVGSAGLSAAWCVEQTTNQALPSRPVPVEGGAPSAAPARPSIPAPVTATGGDASGRWGLRLTAPAGLRPGPTDLRLEVTDATTNAGATLDVEHEKLLHLLLIRKDLGAFQHIHPVRNADGTFSIRAVFPSAGDYLVFANVKPRQTATATLRATLAVPGVAPAATALTPAALATDGPIKARLQLQPAGQGASMLTIDLRDVATGAPRSDIRNYLGARGHAVIVSADGSAFVHAHPVESVAAADAHGMGHGGMHHGAAPAQPAASTIVFHAAFPGPGTYKIWVEADVGGSVRTFPFVVRV